MSNKEIRDDCYSKYNSLINRKIISRLDYCENCLIKKSDEVRIHGHHEDHSKPEQVVWLCSTCHGKVKDTKHLFYVKIEKLTKKNLLNLLHPKEDITTLNDNSFFIRTSDKLTEEQQQNLYIRLNVNKLRALEIVEILDNQDLNMYLELESRNILLNKIYNPIIEKYWRYHRISQKLSSEIMNFNLFARKKYGQPTVENY